MLFYPAQYLLKLMIWLHSYVWVCVCVWVCGKWVEQSEKLAYMLPDKGPVWPILANFGKSQTNCKAEACRLISANIIWPISIYLYTSLFKYDISYCWILETHLAALSQCKYPLTGLMFRYTRPKSNLKCEIFARVYNLRRAAWFSFFLSLSFTTIEVS